MNGRTRRAAAAFGALAVLAGGCGGIGGGAAGDAADGAAGGGGRAAAVQEVGLGVSAPSVLQPAGGLNPTTAVDAASGAVYAAWAREVAGPPDAGGDPRLEAVVARSDDGGTTFSDPVVVSPPGMRIASYTVSPTQVEVGHDGEVYVLFLKNVEADLPGYTYGLSYLQLVRSDDGGLTFSAPVDVAPEASEGVVTTMEMATLFVAPDGDLFVSFLDLRHEITLALEAKAGRVPAGGGDGRGHGDEAPEPPVQLRIVRSGDGGRTFSPSVHVAEPTCACCGTKVAQGQDTPLFATTRSDWQELKGSKDSVRDPFLSVSTDDGRTWSKATKISDDKFKISGCPDVNAGLAVDSAGRLHAAWYTGTDRGPGIYHAVSGDDGKTFSEPVALLSDEWVPYGDVQMVIDDRDRAWVAFEDRRGDVDQVRVVRLDPDGSRRYSSAWPGHAPDLAVHGDEAYLVWAVREGEGHGGSGPVSTAVVRPAAEGEASR